MTTFGANQLAELTDIYHVYHDVPLPVLSLRGEAWRGVEWNTMLI